VKLMAESGSGSIRDGVRWGLLLAAVAVSGYRLPRVARNLQAWRATLPVDPTAADLYRTGFLVEAIGIAIILAVGVGLFYILRPRAIKQT
jgi:hypothetical protein